MLIRPYRAVHGSRSRDIFGVNERWAAREFVVRERLTPSGRRISGAGLNSRAIGLVNSGEIVVQAVRAYRVRSLTDPNYGHVLHAADAGEAVKLAARQGGAGLYGEACDETEWLCRLPDGELAWQARHAWGSLKQLKVRLPSLWKKWWMRGTKGRRRIAGEWSEKLMPVHRQAIIYALRCAMEISALGPPLEDRGKDGERYYSAALSDALGVHGNNVPEWVVRRCVDSGLRIGANPVPAPIRGALNTLAAQYGYRGKDTEWKLALWNTGSPAAR